MDSCLGLAVWLVCRLAGKNGNEASTYIHATFRKYEETSVKHKTCKGYDIMNWEKPTVRDIKDDFEAWVISLRLAVTAPTEAKKNACVTIATALAEKTSADEVEKAKAIVERMKKEELH